MSVIHTLFDNIVTKDCITISCRRVGVGKLLTLGGAGIWWIVDVILLIKGNLVPADGSNWMP